MSVLGYRMEARAARQASPGSSMLRTMVLWGLSTGSLAFLPTPLSRVELGRTPAGAVKPYQLASQRVEVPVRPSVFKWRLKGSEDDAVFGLTDLGGENFGKFGSEKDPHRDIKPIWLDPRASWKQDEGCDFLPELREIQQRIQGVNLYIVGMPGSGKTTVGRMLAEGLNYRWMDLDQFIEKKIGKTATQVFEQDGEESWRKQETNTLRGLQTFVQTVVSTGGGIMTVKDNWPYLHTGLIVWLDLSPDDIVKRMQASGEIEKRPLLKQTADPVEGVKKLYEERKKSYGIADVKVKLSEEDSPIRVLRRVAHRIVEELDMRPPKAKAWEEKREKMRAMWAMMKAKGETTNINEVPEDEEAANPAVAAVAQVRGGPVHEPSERGLLVEQEERQKEEAARQAKRLEEAMAVGSQGLGFGLGLDEYYKGGPVDPSAPGQPADRPQQ